MHQQKGRDGEVGSFPQLAEIAWLLLDLAVESPWLAPGGAISLLLCMNLLGKPGHVAPPSLVVNLFSQSLGAPIGQEP